MLKFEGIVNLQIFWVVRLNNCLILGFEKFINTVLSQISFTFVHASNFNYFVSNSHSKSRRRLKKIMYGTGFIVKCNCVQFSSKPCYFRSSPNKFYYH